MTEKSARADKVFSYSVALSHPLRGLFATLFEIVSKSSGYGRAGKLSPTGRRVRDLIVKRILGNPEGDRVTHV